MKYVARLRYDVKDGELYHCVDEHSVLIPPVEASSQLYELTEIARQHAVDNIEVGRLQNGQKIILLLAGNLEYRGVPKHDDWVIDLTIEWSSLEIIPLVPNKGIDDV